MEKSLFGKDYRIFLALLRKSRRSAGFTQAQLAQQVNQSQSFVSKCERGERRIDIIELRAFCEAVGMPIATFVDLLEEEIVGGKNNG